MDIIEAGDMKDDRLAFVNLERGADILYIDFSDSDWA